MFFVSVPNWPITTSERRAESNGNLEKPLLHIATENIIPDDLHLRIRLTLKLFNQLVSWAIDQSQQQEMVTEMARLGVSFHFWNERGLDNSKDVISKWYQPNGE